MKSSIHYRCQEWSTPGSVRTFLLASPNAQYQTFFALVDQNTCLILRRKIDNQFTIASERIEIQNSELKMDEGVQIRHRSAGTRCDQGNSIAPSTQALRYSALCEFRIVMPDTIPMLLASSENPPPGVED